MNDDLLYQLALAEVPNIGAVQAKILCEQFGSARDIFNASRSSLGKLENIGETRARSIKSFSNYSRAEKEMAFLEKHQIRPLFLKNPEYPQRLLHFADAPHLLFYKGVANLNAPRIISVVGTRRNTEYGETITEELISGLKNEDVLVVSGLAYGIDAIAHRKALECGLDTVGVVGHGLDTIYPAQNAALAKKMVRQGGLLTEFKSETQPDRYNFPSRNRIVAGMSDATVIIETNVKGGSMITADIANGYHKDVFAVPGRVRDTRSNGCNELIRTNRAALLQNSQELLEALGWQQLKQNNSSRHPQLFMELTEKEKKIVELLRSHGQIAIDQLNILCDGSTSSMASALLNLELKNIVRCLPGRRYRLIN